MVPKSYYIKTIGCQMNIYDSERMAMGLALMGCEPAPYPEEADLIIVNTCTIRFKAEHKAFSFLGRLSGLKRKKPDLILGVGGCVAQQEAEKILSRSPFVDLVFGTYRVDRLPEMVKRVAFGQRPLIDVSPVEQAGAFGLMEGARAGGRAACFVTIMQGCDNFCSYCVVPYVRGRERSRGQENILKEIQSLVDSGVREITLLGQNVNSYGKKERAGSFPQLLSRVNEIDGLERLRFTTSHPRDLSDELIESFGMLEKLCNHIHLPVQSGSDRILRAMHRQYSQRQYLERLKKLRYILPDIAVTTDIIVGFPGETRGDFEETLDLVGHADFDGLFAFTYSDRSAAPAVRLPGKISEKEKNERLQKLLALQEQINTDKNQAMIGSTVCILVEGFSKKQHAGCGLLDSAPACRMEWSGRTTTNKVVNFVCEDPTVDPNKSLTGGMVQVKIEKAFSHSLWGRLVRIESRASDSKGERNYAA